MITINMVVPLLGFLFIVVVVCQDCQTNEQLVPVLVNISDNAIFDIRINESRYPESKYLRRLRFYRVFGGIRKELFRIYFHAELPDISPSDPEYYGRMINVSTSKTHVHVTIGNAKAADNGSYAVDGLSKGRDLVQCFILYVIGPPAVSLSFTAVAVQEGDTGHLQCVSSSTTVPTTHNLTMDIHWYVGGHLIENAGRFRVANSELNINYMTRADNNLVVACKAQEHMGLTSWANGTMQINWGPDPGPDLLPANTLYNLQFGDRIPTITCSADCHPDCDVTWTKAGSRSVLSRNGTLSLGSAMENITGEYMCTASRNGTNKTNSKSVIFLVKKYKGEPELHPANTFYHLQPGDLIPVVKCIAHCYPDCEVTWTKCGGLSILARNGVLSLGSAVENITGEYICTASRKETNETDSKSIIILVKEDNVSAYSSQDNTITTTAAVGAVLGAALLLSIICIIVLMRQRKVPCVLFSVASGGSMKGAISTQNGVYEDLKQERDGQESYDAVNLGAIVHDSTNAGGNTADLGISAGEELYENTAEGLNGKRNA